MSGLTQTAIAFVQDHKAWGAPIVFGLAFCESFAFISLIVPATGILFGIGGLIGAAGIEFWSIWLAAAVGAIAGDWLAFELALLFKDRVLRVWPLSHYPELVSRGVGFFERWGVIAVFCGRFFGPLRAIVPIAAGLNAMPRWQFQIANLASAILWATGILAPGFVGVRFFLG
jgi:membrane protein DedA with SNARE-associated domain